MDNKRILMITSRADIGGGPKHVYDLVRSIKKNNKIFIAIASPDEPPYGKKFKEICDHFIQIPKRSFNPIAFLKILIFCFKYKITVIHSHGRGGGLFSRLLGIFGFKIVHTFHGAHFNNNFIGKIKLLLDKFLAPMTDRFICVSNDEKNKIIEYKSAVPQKINVILNGIDYMEINSYFSIKTTNNNEQLILGTLARFTYQKGIDLMLETVKNSEDFFRSKKIIIKVAGDGEDFLKTDQMRHQYEIDDIVYFEGQKDDPVEFLSNIDIYISFARWEGLPLSVLEAMSCPLPCLLSSVTGHNDLVKNNEAILFNNTNPVDFTNKLEIMLAQNTREELAKKSYELIQKNHSLEKMTCETISVYRHL